MEMEKLCKLVDTELDKYAAQTTLNDNMIASLYRLVDIKKDLCEISMKEMEMNGGYSNRAYGLYYDDGRRDVGGNSYSRMPRYYYNDMGNSYNDGMYRNNGYSRGSAMEHLQMAMDSARDEQEREAIRQAMSQLNR